MSNIHGNHLNLLPAFAIYPALTVSTKNLTSSFSLFCDKYGLSTGLDPWITRSEIVSCKVCRGTLCNFAVLKIFPCPCTALLAECISLSVHCFHFWDAHLDGKMGEQDCECSMLSSTFPWSDLISRHLCYCSTPVPLTLLQACINQMSKSTNKVLQWHLNISIQVTSQFNWHVKWIDISCSFNHHHHHHHQVPISWLSLVTVSFDGLKSNGAVTKQNQTSTI